MIFHADGLDLTSWEQNLEIGQTSTPMDFFEQTRAMNLRNSVFVDVTANKIVAATYEHYLKESTAVVACNKIACSGPVEYYKKLKKLSIQYNAPLLFETNVGLSLIHI